jgi:NAD-dependent DNA ligase
MCLALYVDLWLLPDCACSLLLHGMTTNYSHFSPIHQSCAHKALYKHVSSLQLLALVLLHSDVGERQAANLAAKYKTMKRLQLAANGTAFAAAAASAAATAAPPLDPSTITNSSSSVTASRRRRRTTNSTSSSTTLDSSTTAAAAAAAEAPEPDPEISGQMGASLAAWFADAHNKLLLNELRDAGIAVCQEDPAAADVVTEDPTVDVPGSIPGGLCGVAVMSHPVYLRILLACFLL